MTDKQWVKIIDKSVKHLKIAFSLRVTAEEEYVKRYGNHPSEIDDDWWIDTLHYARGTTDLSKIIESAELHKRRIQSKNR